jgi:malate dehydrogenase (quinone)
MLDLLERCFPEEYPGWEPTLRELIPTLGKKLNTDPALAQETLAETADELQLTA